MTDVSEELIESILRAMNSLLEQVDDKLFQNKYDARGCIDSWVKLTMAKELRINRLMPKNVLFNDPVLIGKKT